MSEIPKLPPVEILSCGCTIYYTRQIARCHRCEESLPRGYDYPLPEANSTSVTYKESLPIDDDPSPNGV